jgi:hypothetical protein
MEATKAVRKNNRLRKSVAQKSVEVKPMVENAELTPEQKLAAIQAELDQANAKIREQDEKLKKKSGKPGWIIRTENPDYKGITNGIKFDHGVGIIPGEDESLAKLICDDFGYKREYVEDVFTIPEITDQITNNMAVILGGLPVKV